MTDKITQKLRWLLLLLALLLWAPVSAQAGEEELFKGLLPGKKMSDKEMAKFYGRGVAEDITINSGEESVINIDGPLTDEDVDQILDLHLTNGVTTGFTIVGDDNTTNVNIIIDVDIGTVSVEDSTGVTVTQALDLGGSVVQALGN